MQFCARRPSMTESSLTFRVLTQRSSMEPVSFCRTETTGMQFRTSASGWQQPPFEKTKQHQFDLRVRCRVRQRHTLEETHISSKVSNSNVLVT